MALDAVQKSPDSPNKVSYLKASAIGALTGYSLKYIIPVTHQEKDEAYNSALKEIRLKTRKMKAAEVEKIRKSPNKTELTDTFIRMHDSKKLLPSNIRKLKSPLKDDLLDMVKRLNEEARENMAIEKRNLNAMTKSIRSTAIFVSIGIGAGLLIALVTNIIKRIDFYNSQYANSEEAESN